MRLIKKICVTFGILLFYCSNVFAQTSTISKFNTPFFVIVPSYSETETLVANLVTQKLFLLLKNNKEIQKEAIIHFANVNESSTNEVLDIAKYYFNQKGYNLQVIAHTQYNKTAKTYTITLVFFHQDTPQKPMTEITFDITRAKAINAFSFSELVDADTLQKVLSNITTLISTPIVTRKNVLSIKTIYKHRNLTPDYFVRLNGDLKNASSPQRIILKKNIVNVVEIIQYNKKNKEVILDSFTIRPIFYQYFIDIVLKNEEELYAVLDSENSISLFPTKINVAGGYSNILFSKNDISIASNLVNVALQVNLNIISSVPNFSLRFGVPLITEITYMQYAQDTKDRYYTFTGVTMGLGYSYTILKKIEIGGHIEGGMFTIARGQNPGGLAKIVTEEYQISPQANAGLDITFNIPLRTIGYLNILGNASLVYTSVSSVENVFNEDTVSNVTLNTPLIFFNTSLGLGIRF